MLRLMTNKAVILLAALAVLLITGISFAATSGTGTITPTTGGVSGGGIANVTAATSGQPSWSPIAGAAGSITAGNLYSIDTTGSNPYTGSILVTLYLRNPDELVESYTYLTSQVNVKVLSSSITNEAVGTGNGSATVFYLDNAPVAPTTLVVKVAGVTKTETTDYTVDYKLGKVTFVAAPANAAAVTADYWYYDAASGTDYKQATTANGKDIDDTYLTLSNGSVSFILAGDSGGVKYRVTIDDGTFYCTSTGGTLSPAYYLTVVQS